MKRRIFNFATLLLSVVVFAQTPGDVGNTDLIVWLKANVGTNTTTDGVGITSWDDQSTNNYDAVGTGDATYLNNAFNFNPVIELNGGGSPLESSGTISRPNAGASTVFLVAKHDATSPLTGAFFEFGEQTHGKRQFFLIERYSSNIKFSATSGTPTADQLNIFTISDPGGLPAIALFNENNVPFGVGVNSQLDTSWSTNSAYSIGDDLRGLGSNQMDNASVAELIYYDRQLTDSEIAKIESYLAIKYGVTINNDLGGANGDYILSDDTIIWDASANNAYHYNIIGVGRDDDSGLIQNKSQETETKSSLKIEKVGSFTSDLASVIVGHNNVSELLGTTNKPESVVLRSKRTWKAEVNGLPGTLNVTFNLDELGIPNTGVVGDYFMLQDADEDFTNANALDSGATLIGNELTFTGIDFSLGQFFSLGVVKLLFAPGNVKSGIVSWFAADADAPVNTDGVAMTEWDNIASFTDATQAGISDLPVFTENKFNFNPAVYFGNGDNGYFDVNLDLINNSDYNIIAVVERASNVNENYFIGTNASIADEGLHVGYLNNTTLRSGQVSNEVDLATNEFDNPKPSVTIIRAQLDTSTGRILQELRDTTFSESTNTSTTALTGNNSGVIGRGFENEGFEGYVSEIVVYNQTISEENLNKVYSYLALKYGLTLDPTDGITNGDYQDSDANIIWDYSNNISYHNHVIGIGFDTKSNLNQLKSKETNSVLDFTIEKELGFVNDQSFIVMGSDTGSEELVTNGVHSMYRNRLEKTWKVQTSGSTEQVNISFTIGGGIVPNTNFPHDYALLIDNDTDFSDSTPINSDVEINGNTLTFKNVTLNTGDILTLAYDLFIAHPAGVGQDELTLWLKADEGTNTSTEGAIVSSWIDQGFNSYLLTDVDAGASGQPTFKENSFNFNPTIQFNGGSLPLSVDGVTRANGTDATMFIVQKKSSISNEAFMQFSGTPGTNQHIDDDNYIFSAAYNSVSPGLTVGEATILTYSDSSAGNTLDLYENGESFGVLFNEQGLNWITSDFTVGHNTIGSDPLNGEIAEIVYYDRLLSQTEIDQVNSYLAIKYGVGLDGVNYIDSSSNTIWDATINASYASNIIGIGRDDLTSLNQKQATSSSPGGVLTIALGNTIELSNSANLNVFNNDLDYLIIGHDDTDSTLSEVPSTVVETCLEFDNQLDRNWKVANRGNVSGITLSFDLTGLTNPADFILLVDDDGDFSTGLLDVNTNGILDGNSLIFNNVNSLVDGAVFTLGKSSITPDIVYNGTWSGGSGTSGELTIADGTKSVQIEADVTLPEDAVCDCIQVENGVVLTIPTSQFLQIENSLMLQGDIYLEGDAELIQTELVNTNIGTGNLYKIIDDATDSSYIYNYFSAPVNNITTNTFTIDENLKFKTGATLADNTDPSYTTNSTGTTATTISTRWTHTLNNDLAFIEIDEDTPIAPGVGFTMKGTGGTDVEYNFIGKPNNGTIQVPLTTGNFLLTGNPYPSTIDATAFNTANVSTAGGATDGVIYLWDQSGTGITSHSQDDDDGTGGYATITDGVGVAAATFTDGGGAVPGATVPTEFIRPGQGFVVYGDATGDVEYTNSLRTGIDFTSEAQAAHFFKTKTLKTIIPTLRLGFEFENENGKTYHRQLASVFNGVSMEREVGKDAYMFDYYSNDMYWILPNDPSRFIISSVPSISEDLELPIGVVLDSDKEVTFKLDDIDAVSSPVYLFDNEENTLTNIIENNKTIALESGVYQNRFSLVFGNNNTLSDNSINTIKTKFTVLNDNLEITLEDGYEIQEVSIFSISGSNIKSIILNDVSNHAFVDIFGITNQVYIAKIKTNKGVIHKKFIIK